MSPTKQPANQSTTNRQWLIMADHRQLCSVLVGHGEYCGVPTKNDNIKHLMDLAYQQTFETTIRTYCCLHHPYYCFQFLSTSPHPVIISTHYPQQTSRAESPGTAIRCWGSQICFALIRQGASAGPARSCPWPWTFGRRILCPSH